MKRKGYLAFAQLLFAWLMPSASAADLTVCAVLTGTGGENKRDDFGVHLHRIMTAEGVHCAFVGTGSDRYGTIPATPESEKDELVFSRRPEVLMATPEIGFRRPPFSPTFTNNTDVMSSMIRCRINLPNRGYHRISRVARRVFESEGLQAANRKSRYDKEKLLWQTTVAIKSEQVK